MMKGISRLKRKKKFCVSSRWDFLLKS